MTPEYTKNLVCFIDVLGFKSTIKQSEDNAEIVEALYKLITELQPNELYSNTYANIPVFDCERNNNHTLR